MFTFEGKNCGPVCVNVGCNDKSKTANYSNEAGYRKEPAGQFVFHKSTVTLKWLKDFVIVSKYDKEMYRHSRTKTKNPKFCPIHANNS